VVFAVATIDSIGSAFESPNPLPPPPLPSGHPSSSAQGPIEAPGLKP
jgi:hypothetical protein